MTTFPTLRTGSLAALAAMLSAFWTSAALAHSGGMSGASGMDNGYFCRNCHAGGTTPTLDLEGPSVMGLDSTALFRFTVSSHSATQIAAGIDVAASAGNLDTVANQGTILLLGDVTHSEPKLNDANGQASFEFTWRAPATAGTYTLYAAATSVNLDGKRTGDAAQRMTFDIHVGIDTPTPTQIVAPSATVTATPTEVPSTCGGDCGGDGEVTVDEIILMVNIALEVTPVAACEAGDTNKDGTITVDEIVAAVNNALNGCPA